MNPRVFKKEGLKHLDRVIDIVSLYTFLSCFLTREIEFGEMADLGGSSWIVCQVWDLYRHRPPCGPWCAEYGLA